MTNAALLPHLKLPPDRVIAVLKAVKDDGPERASVAERVLRLFGNKSEKSVFRGMALPAITRLHLARTSRAEVWLAPNGNGYFFLGDRGVRLIGLTIRRLGIDQFGLAASMLRSPNVFDRELEPANDSEAERGKRFRAYLIEFPYERERLREFARTPNGDLRLRLQKSEFRDLLAEAGLPHNTLMPLDEVRDSLLQRAWERGWLATSFDVDDWLVAEAQADRPAVQLWKKAERSIDEIFYGTASFGGVTVRGSGR